MNTDIKYLLFIIACGLVFFALMYVTKNKSKIKTMKLLIFLSFMCVLSACSQWEDAPDPEVGLVNDSTILSTAPFDAADSFSVSGCCDYVTTTWDLPGASKLAIIDDRHERIIPISDSGSYKSYVVDAIEIRNASNMVLASKYIENCCPRRYRVDGAFIYFNQPGDYTIHKKSGFGTDVGWLRKYKAYNNGSQFWVGNGTFVVTWISPNKSYHTVDIVRIY